MFFSWAFEDELYAKNEDLEDLLYDKPNVIRNSLEKRKKIASLMVSKNISSEHVKTLEFFKRMNPKKRFTTISTELMTPTTLEIKLLPINEVPHFSAEVWFSGKAVVISKSMFSRILYSLHRQGYKLPSGIISDFDRELDKIHDKESPVK